jgi:membrane protein YqaA with SNARE-associated domain
VGSILGGTVGFFIGRTLGTTQWMIRFFQTRGAEAYAITKRYGLVALALAAFTPIPYSIVCWACGAVKIRLRDFLLISLLRIPRVALYLWLIQQGFVAMPA